MALRPWLPVTGFVDPFLAPHNGVTTFTGAAAGRAGARFYGGMLDGESFQDAFKGALYWAATALLTSSMDRSFFADPQNTPPRTIQDIKKAFYQSPDLTSCIRSVFGKDAKRVFGGSFALPKNAPRMDTTRTTATMNALYKQQGGVLPPIPGASVGGMNDPTKGPHGTIYLPTETFVSTAPNAANANIGTYAHEWANIVDERLNPFGKGGKSFGMVYGNPKDPIDQDTGAKFERCLFAGKLQGLNGPY